MTSYSIDPLTAQGIAAAKTGRSPEARRYFEAALSQNQNNVVAWWWLARVMDDRHASHKCLEQCRSVAVVSQEGLDTYRSLLQESNAPSIQPFQLDSRSRSIGSQCPIDTDTLKAGDLIIICPICHIAHHVDCWECNAYHCGNYACEGSGLVDRQAHPQIESPADTQAVTIDDSAISEASPYATREEKEAGFIGQLRARAVAAMIERQMRQARAAKMAQQVQEARALREAELRAQETVNKASRGCIGFIAGTIVGAILAYAANSYFHSWLIFGFIVFLGALSLSSIASHAYAETDRFTGGIYWLLPKLGAAGILYFGFNQWDKAWLAVLVAAVGGFIVECIFNMSALRERRAFITYTTIALGALFSIKYFVERK